MSGFYARDFGELSLIVNAGFKGRRMFVEFPNKDIGFNTTDISAAPYISSQTTTGIWDTKRLLTKVKHHFL